MRLLFAFGFSIAPIGTVGLAYLIQRTPLWFFMIWPALLMSYMASNFFDAGRNSRALSSAPITSGYRKSLGFILGVLSGCFCTAVMFIFSRWVSGAWLWFLVAVTVIVVAATSGYFFGSLFKWCTVKWPGIKLSDKLIEWP